MKQWKNRDFHFTCPTTVVVLKWVSYSNPVGDFPFKHDLRNAATIRYAANRQSQNYHFRVLTDS